MKLSVNIPDNVYESYVKRYGVSGAYNRIRKVLDEMKDVDPNDRYILVAGDDRRAIEAIFQTTLDDAAKLARMVTRLNAVRIGDDARIDFTADELERLKMQAAFHGRTYETFVTEMAAEIKGFMLERV